MGLIDRCKILGDSRPVVLEKVMKFESLQKKKKQKPSLPMLALMDFRNA